MIAIRALEAVMALWKRLSGADGKPVDVNIDQVCYLHRAGEVTNLYFAAATSDRFLVLPVKEDPDRIHSIVAL
jgi:hypothetical protein